jgi:hypothetical protein
VAPAALLAAALMVGIYLSSVLRTAPETPAHLSELDFAPVPPQTLSQLGASIQYDFRPLLAEVERVVPITFGSLDEYHLIGGDARRRFAFELVRSPFTIFMVGANVHLRANVSYAVRAVYNPPIGPTLRAGCGGRERPEVLLELVTPISISSDWRLRSRVRLSHLGPASAARTDRCLVSILRYDVTDLVIGSARDALQGYLAQIDSEVHRVDLSSQAREWWSELNRPIRLDDDLWLLLDPRELRAGRITGRGYTLSVEAALDAYPRIVAGSQPAATPQGLPPLGSLNRTSGFVIVVDGAIDYGIASRQVTEEMFGRTISHSGRTVTVGQIVISPAPAGRLALNVGFSGDANGELRFVGTPVYSLETDQIIVPDLDYDLETDSPLINAVAWLRSDELRALFREHSVLPVAPVRERSHALLTSGLNRPIGEIARVAAVIDSVGVQGLYVTVDGLVVRGTARGTASVHVGTPPEQ